MKTSFITALVIILHTVPKTKGNEKFKCPVECPSNVYRPICSRGKSYANLCVLKQEICKGKAAREVYDDVEACPGYEKEDDASGKSVETIDKNGVIFRHLIDSPKKEFSTSTEVPDRTTTTARTRKKMYHARRGGKGGRSREYPLLCTFLERATLRACILKNDSSRHCPLQLNFCKYFLRKEILKAANKCPRVKNKRKTRKNLLQRFSKGENSVTS